MKKSLHAMRSCVTPLICLLIAAFVLSSCGRRETYTVEYPAEYTALYFYNNYVQCDPNLIHLRAAENSAGKLKRDPARYEYYAIKDVPMEEYVCYSEDFVLFDPGFSPYVARNKAVEMPQPEVLTWTVSGAELYWHNSFPLDDSRKGKMTAVGEKIRYESVAEVDGAAFQARLATAMEEESYLENGEGCHWSLITKRFTNEEGVKSSLTLYLRLRFAEYANIVWDGHVVTIDGESGYFVYCYRFTASEKVSEGYYRDIFVPLPKEIAELIPET
ncbi:MAG: hypothetical protein IJA91_01535 [Clostridia bacterium]|nr:hypothetical protein [Clostridia bacterium]